MRIGVSDEDFWNYTPHEIKLLMKEYEKYQFELDYRSALTPWIVASVFRGKTGRKPKLEDFMLHKPPKAEQKPDDMLRALKAITMMSGGEIQTKGKRL